MAGHKLIIVPTGRFDGRSYILLCPETKAAVIIDPDINVDEILRILDSEGCTAQYILLTHCHYDHVSSSDLLREKTGARTAIHALEVPSLADPRLNMSEQFQQPLITGRTIDIVLEEGSVIHAGTIEIKVLHTPGHTPGGCCFLAGTDLFTGDTLFRGSYGYTGFPGGDMETLTISAARLLSMDEAITIYPGHGQPSTIGRERAMNPINI